nr:MAG TPA: hypothetical protein [Caudoviricetes sp.]
MWPFTRCSGGDGLTCREPTPQIVADASSWWVDRRASAP